MLENIPFGFIRVDRDGVINYANTSMSDMLKMSKEALIGTRYDALPWGQYKEDFTPLRREDHTLYQALNGRTAESVSTLLVIDRQPKWFSISTSPYYEKGVLVGAISCLVDITEKKKVESKLKIDVDRYKILIENIDAVIWESERDSLTFGYVSPKVEALFGYPLDLWFEPYFWQKNIHPEDLAGVLAFEKEQHFDYQLEYRFATSSGAYKWVRDHVKVIREEEKVLLRGVMLDITKSKEAEFKLLESKDRYKKLIDEAPYAITIYNKEGDLITANNKSEEYWKISMEEALGNFNVFDSPLFKHPQLRKGLKRAFNGRSGETTINVTLGHSENEERVFRVKYYPLLDKDGALDNVVYFNEDVTEIVEAQQKTHEQELLKRGILDALADGILVVGKGGTVLNINKSLAHYLKEETDLKINVGESLFDFKEGLEGGEFILDAIDDILSQKSDFFEHQLKLRNGKWHSLRMTKLLDRVGVVISLQDIDTRKRGEIALDNAFQKYRNIFNKAPVMMHSLDANRHIVNVSDYWLEKMEYSREEVIGKSPLDFLAEHSKKEIVKNLQDLRKVGEIKNKEYQYIKKSGEVMDVLASSVAELDVNGALEGAITGMIDITEQKEAERKLQQSSARLLEAQKISRLGGYELIPQKKTIRPSEEMALMMGLGTQNQSIDKLYEIVHKEDVQGLKKSLEESLSSGHDLFCIYRITNKKTASQQWISQRGKLIHDPGQKPKLIGTVQDISEQMLAEDKIERLSDRILLATEIANLGVWEYDVATRAIFWEDQMYRIFSDAQVPLRPREFERYFTEESKAMMTEFIHQINNGANFLEYEFQISVSGEIKYLRSFSRILRNETGAIQRIIGVLYDITGDKQLQQDLKFSLDEKNILIKEVHHRVKNNMQLISSIMALRAFDLEDDESKEVFDDINTRIKSMALIHDKLYKFYNVSEIDVREYLTHISQELRVLLGLKTIEIAVKSDKLIMNIDQVLLVGLVVSELTSNAAKHSFGGREKGNITILFTRKKDRKSLAVINDGAPIAPDVIDTNSGLGMTLIKTFAKQLKGTLSHDPRNGFRIDF